MIPLVTASEAGSAQSENRGFFLFPRIVASRGVTSGGAGPSFLEQNFREGDSPVLCPASCFHVRCAFIESRSLGFERKMCDKFHIKLNTGARPIANKYCEGKMKRTLERELKVPEIAGREAIETFVSFGCPWVFGFSFPSFRYRIWGLLFPFPPVDPLGLVSISSLASIFPLEGKPFVGCYSLGLFCSPFC